jgi:phosphoenolpyruvate-protein kinase (PTS system EI component)
VTTPEHDHAAGTPVVEGIAIGQAVLWASDPEPRAVAGTRQGEHGRLARAVRLAIRDVEALIGRLPPAEAELFMPEVAILAELGPLLIERVDAGATAEEAVNEATSPVSTDLLLDARARLLDELGQVQRSVESLLEGRDGDRILVTGSLTPSVVASLPPQVVGIVAASDGPATSGGAHTSHAVILARGRSIPLAFVPPNVVLAIADDDAVVLDTTGAVASLWVRPGESTIADARHRQEQWLIERAQDEAHVAAPLTHLGLEVHVNIGSVYERIPASTAGIGLLRTELVFSGRARPPGEMEQFAALRAIAAPVGVGPVVVRLFDAGGDKPLAWLQPSSESPHARGIELLFMHPEILATQLRAIVRAAEHFAMRVLLPIATSAKDVERVRELSRGKLAVGAMIETPAAVDQIDEVAAAADFISIGTNDLLATVTGVDRSDALSVDARTLRMIERVIAVAHSRSRKVSVCGEMAGDPHGAKILVGLGVDAISVAPTRFAKVKLSLRDATLDDCRAVAKIALQTGAPPGEARA